VAEESTHDLKLMGSYPATTGTGRKKIAKNVLIKKHECSGCYTDVYSADSTDICGRYIKC